MNFFSAEVSKFCQLRVLNKFIQQRFSFWSKANWTEKLLKFKPLAYLDPCEKSMMNFFCEYMTPFISTKTLHRTCFTEFWMRLWNLFDILIVMYCMHFKLN